MNSISIRIVAKQRPSAFIVRFDPFYFYFRENWCGNFWKATKLVIGYRDFAILCDVFCREIAMKIAHNLPINKSAKQNSIPKCIPRLNSQVASVRAFHS